MKSTRENTVGSNTHVAQFAKVLDGRKQPIRGLWERNGRYYAQLKIEDALTGEKKTRRVPLMDKNGDPVKSRAEAVAEMERLRVKRTDGTLPVLKRTPLFSDYAKQYTDRRKALGEQGTKRNKSATVEKLTASLGRWSKVIGTLRVDQIKKHHIDRFITQRLEDEIGPRTIELDKIALRSVLKDALKGQLIVSIPPMGDKLEGVTKKRQLVTAAELEKICAAAFETKKDNAGKDIPLTKNGQQFADFIKFMAYSGTRRNEALAMRWEDVDFGKNHLTVGASGDTKNSKARTVDFNPKLRAHLLEMKERGKGVSKFLFPSPQRGDKDASTKTFKESLWLVRERAGLPHFTFHDCRHHFISMAVMSGVDFMTIAAWVGHQDGGVLIGKVYGHLANEHKKAMADKEGRLYPRVSGFDYVENPNIPTNGENLKGMAVHKGAILCAFAPVPPVAEVLNAGTKYELFIDDASGVILEYRSFGNNVLDKATHTIESNYGFQKGLGTGLKRIVAP